MPVINLKSETLHRELKIKAATAGSTIVDLAELYIGLGLKWGLDDMLIAAIEDAASQQNMDVGSFLISAATATDVKN